MFIQNGGHFLRSATTISHHKPIKNEKYDPLNHLVPHERQANKNKSQIPQKKLALITLMNNRQSSD